MCLCMFQIAIKDSANPLPTVMYQGFERFDIKIVLEVSIPLRSLNKLIVITNV